MSLSRLFFTFFKIGCTSFGGFMALISVVQNQFVIKEKIVEDKVILDGISLASILPGPIAVNFVTYVGFTLKGLKGALVSMVGVILPSFILIVTAAYIYFEYGDVFHFDHFFKGVVPSVAAIILVVATTMTKKQIKGVKQLPILILAGLAVYFYKGFYTTFIVIGVAGFIGFFFYNTDGTIIHSKNIFKWRGFLNKIPQLIVARKNELLILFIVLISILSIRFFFVNQVNPYFSQLWLISTTFSSISVFLFGGGYVFIPAIQDVVVNQLQWVSSIEFVDAIALGQITPGPILISAAFIGFKISGFWGALVATISIFLPPSLLMIMLSKFYSTIKQQPIVEAIFKGIRPAVIGMIFSAVPVIFLSIEFSAIGISIFLATAFLAYWFKVNALLLIPSAGIVGLILL